MKCKVYFLGITEVELNPDDIINNLVNGDASNLLTTTEEDIKKELKSSEIEIDNVQSIYRNDDLVFEE